MIQKILIAIFALFSFQCTSTPMPAVFSFGQATVHSETNGTQFNSNRILKSGESCSYGSNFLFFNLNLFYFGDGGSIEEAKLKGGVKKIAILDRKTSNVLFNLIYKQCIVVWGE